MTKGLILLDLDKTLIGTNFVYTNTGIFDAVKILQADGWTIGLNSDRAIINLRKYKELFGLNGPLICELGNIIETDQDSEPRWTQPRLQSLFIKLFKSLVQLLRTDYPQVIAIISDNERAQKILAGARLDTTVLLFLLNSLRQASLAFNAFYLEAYTLRGFSSAPDLLQEIAAEVTEMFISIFDCKPICSMDARTYNLCMLHHPDSSKTLGAAALLQNSDYSRVFMVGDTTFDYLEIKGVTHCAVGNASPEFKQLCQFVAPHTLTSGVIECLEWINQSS